MKFKNFYLPALISACMLSSCVDDKYDLSDIDTTVRVEVNDLTIPLNLDEIYLSNIIEEGDQLKIVNGEYCITESGDFTSSAVKIDGFTIQNSQEFEPTKITIPFNPAIAALVDEVTLPIEPEANHFNFTANDIPAEITAITDIQGDLKFKFLFSLPGMSQIASKVEIRDMVIQLPKGLTLHSIEGSDYDIYTGLLTLPTQTVMNDKLELPIEASKLNFDILGAKLDNETHSIDISGDFYVKSATFVIKTADIHSSAQATDLELTIDYSISDFPLTAVSGRINYNISGVNISDVELNDLPDVLTQEGTNITLANPQIYLNIETPNPLEEYSLYAEAGLTISSVHGNTVTPYSINNGFFTIGQRDGKSFYSFCLAPSKPADVPENDYVPFSDLGKVVSGNGIPSALKISLDDPRLPDQPVVDFNLGSEIGEIKGNYEFVAPIALGTGSKIVYSDKMDGWDSESLEDLTITELHIAATLTSDIPLSIDFQAKPIDKDGKPINNVEIKGAKIEASSQPQDVDIYITGTIKDLAGVEFTATAVAKDEKALSPDMTIKVAKLRPRVTGYYEKEL